MGVFLRVGGQFLVVFGVMLTAHRNFVSLRTSGGEWILALFVGGGLLVLLLQTITIDSWRQPSAHDVALLDHKTTTEIGLALTGVRLDGHSGFLLPFVIVSVHLLVVLIGAAYLARTKRLREREPAQ